MRRVFPALLIASFLFSCAPKAAVKAPGGAAGELPPVEELVLPELPSKPAPSEAPSPKPETARVEEDGQYIMLNFDGASIETVIATFAELLEMNYMLASGVSGTVTIQSYKKFPIKDLFYIFQTILEINGLTAVKDELLYRIVPIDTAKQQPLDVEKGMEVRHRVDSGFVTQLMPLEYVKAAEAANILRSLAPRGTDIIIYDPANMMIVTALPRTLSKFIKVIEALDVSDAERETVKTFVYYVENGEAKKLAEILKQIYPETKGREAQRTAAPARPGVPAPVQPSVSAGEALPGEIGELTITAYEDINAIIVKTDPRSYLALLKLLKKIDVPVKQVLIEVLVAEVSLKDDMTLGLEWLIKQNRGYASGVGGFSAGGIGLDESGSIGPILSEGFSAYVAGIIDNTVFGSVINALAKKGKVNVLASPHILAMDNKEANIHIGEEVPIATGLTQQPATATAGTTLVTTGQIQYKSIGTKLAVTPHITEKDKVTVKVRQEVSGRGAPVKVAGQDFEGFTTRTAETTAVVQSGRTLVLGGLIREEKGKSRSGIPLLGSIPLLGYLFSSTTERYDKTELVVMLTPHVISSQEEADALTEEFKNRVRTVRKGIVRLEKEKARASKERIEKEEAKRAEEERAGKGDKAEAEETFMEGIDPVH